MLNHYLTVGIRAFTKNKIYAFINIFGLALGLAACLLILLFVRYEMSYDSWIPEADRAYQFQAWYNPTENGGEEAKFQMTSYASRAALVKDFPQIEKTVYVGSGGAVIIQDGKPSFAEFKWVDGNLFDILPVSFLRGDRETALDGVNSLVLTEAEATKRFGPKDPIGKTLTLVSEGESTDYKVTGVIENPRKNSHMSLGIVARFHPKSFFSKNPSLLSSWESLGGWVYVKLKPGTNADDINSQLQAWEKRNIPDDTSDGRVSNPGDAMDWRLVNVRDIHLGEGQQAAVSPGNDYRTIVTFGIIAILTLGMAVTNFINLATAGASQRAREVALRKVMGASRKQLITQFLGESVLVTAVAMLIALGIAELSLPAINQFLGADIALNYVGKGGLLFPILALVVLVGAAGGLYPASYLSRFQPAKVLKANQSSSDAEGSGRFRNILVVFQFAVSIGLIICTGIIYAQTVYARTSDAGYKREGLLQIYNVDAVQPVIETLHREIEQMPGVSAAALTGIEVNPSNNTISPVYLPGSQKPVELGTYAIEPKFIPTMGMEMLAGRNFSQAIPMDDATTPSPIDAEAERAIVQRGINVILSRTAAERLGFNRPGEAIGKQINTRLTPSEFGQLPATIIGVVKDARFRSVRDPLQPIMYYYATAGYNAMVVRYQSPERNKVMSGIESVWNRVVPDVPFRADFVDDRVRELYGQEEARAQLFAAFALLAVVIGCLGVFGLATFAAERRTKEIGIRKVLGARSRDIVRLLAWQFAKPVLIANLIAWPVAWWVMRDWLNTFDARIDLEAAPFVLAGLLALAIAVATIAGHAIKVARAKPIHALRYE